MGTLKNDVRIIKGEGGLGRLPSSSDYISGMVFYSDTLPSGFSASAREKVFFSMTDVEKAGITGDSSDATAATCTIQITAAGAEGEKITVTVEGLQIAEATIPATPTVDLVAAAVNQAINDNTPDTGYSATVLTDTVTLTAPLNKGEALNTLSPVVGHSGSSTSTETAFAGGVGSLLDVLYYHLFEYFRIIGAGQVFTGIYAVPTTFDFTEIQTLQNYAKGEIRQCAIYQAEETFTTTQLNLINNVCSDLFTIEDRPLSALLAGEISGVDITTLPDLRNFDYPYVSAVIGQDGLSDAPNAAATRGQALFAALGKSVTCVGAALGTVSLSAVNENIGYVRAYNISDGTSEYQEPTIANGTFVKSMSVSLRNTLSNRAYIYLANLTGIEGTYFNDSYTATAETSDYHFIENERVIDKASRSLRTNLLPLLNSPLQVNPDTGALDFQTIKVFESAGNTALNALLANNEISGFKVKVDPDQDVLTTSKIVVVCEIVPTGTARSIEVPLSFTPKLS